MSLSALDILRRGRERIARDGWVQGAYGCRGTGWDATSALGWQGYASAKAYRTLRDSADPTINLARWNDAPGRTVEQVLDAYDRAIATLEAQR